MQRRAMSAGGGGGGHEHNAPTIPHQADEKPSIRKTDEQVINEVIQGELSSTALESELKDFVRAVSIRRQVIERKEKMVGSAAASSLKQVPWKELDYSLVRAFSNFFP